MAEIRTALERLYPPLPKCPPNHDFGTIKDLYSQYLARLEGSSVVDPLGREVYFLAENFPHLIKLEFFNNKVKQWVEASALVAVGQLKAGTLDENLYRIGDMSRPRTLFWVPQVLENPDSIYDNKRNNGTDVYVKRYSRYQGSRIKVALVAQRQSGQRVIVTSFWSNDSYVKGCVKNPPKHSNREGHP